MEMKETKELLIGLVLLGKLVADRVKDGVQIDDAIAIGEALLKDGEFKTKIEAAYKDADKINDEFKDFDFVKGLSLVQIVPELIAIINTPKV